jgi:hypothetical protein
MDSCGSDEEGQTMNRRLFLQALAAPLLAGELPQGPFDVDQDEGWQTVFFTRPSTGPLRNPGLGLIGYTWEENGPALSVRSHRETLEQAVENIASLPFVDVLYIRCDWRNVQRRAGELSLDPVWKLTLDVAKRHGMRVAFRIQLSNPEFEPEKVALPDFLLDKVPFVPIGNIQRRGRSVQFREPRYDNPEFVSAFRELNSLLAQRFDDDPLIEFMDLMMYGFWGEGHTSDLHNPFPNSETAQRTFRELTAIQLSTWKRVPLADNTQPDISHVGNRAVLEMCLDQKQWLRSDSIEVEEPVQIDQLSNRPTTSAVIIEDGSHRRYEAKDDNALENQMLHALDLGANYWALWTEAGNLKRFAEQHPETLAHLRQRIGYRVRPAWVWQRKRSGTFEVIVAVANAGVASVPGRLILTLESSSWKLSGSLDPGQPHANGIREAAFLLPRGFAGPVRLSAQLEIKPGNVRPVHWACQGPLNEDGSLTVGLKLANDPGWRKGV